MKQLIILSIVLLVVHGHGSHEGGECKSGFGRRDFMDRYMRTCMNITFPEEMKTIVKDCFKKTIMDGTMVTDLAQGKFPDRAKIGQFMNNLEMCKLKASGIPNPETQIDADSLIKASMMDKWMGDPMEIDMIRKNVTSCFSTAKGTTSMEKLNSANKCMVQGMIDYCTGKGEDPGMMLPMAAKLLTINDQSPCSVVKIPQQAITTRDQCFEEEKMEMEEEKMKMMNDSRPDKMKKSKDPMRKLKKMTKYFMKEFMMEVMMCCCQKSGFYDNTTNMVNVTAIADYVKSFVGWNSIPTQRDEVYKAIMDCGNKVYGPMAMMNNNNMNDNSSEINDKSSSPEEGSDEMMEDLMKKKLDYEKCFSPKFAQTCGINNDLAGFLYPPLDSEFMGTVLQAYMDFTEVDGDAVMDMLKDKMGSPP